MFFPNNGAIGKSCTPLNQELHPLWTGIAPPYRISIKITVLRHKELKLLFRLFLHYLSRNYSFADKEERTVGRSKVVRKFLCRNFLPLEVKKA